jgi:hypothetical protein
MAQPDQKIRLDQPAHYIIEIQGRLAQDWSNHFSGMTLEVISTPTGNTISRLTGVLPDQPALHGLMQKIRDYNLLLLRVELTGTTQESAG